MLSSRLSISQIAKKQSLKISIPYNKSCHYAMPARPRIFEKNDKLTNSPMGPRAHPRREMVTWVIGLWVPGGHVNLAALVNDVISLR